MNTIDMHIVDLVNNSLKAKANEIEIKIHLSLLNKKLSIYIKDNGFGMDSETLKIVCDPYYTSRKERKVGLGLPLFKFHAEITRGVFKINSKIDCGTEVYAEFNIDHPDCQPTGDISGTISRFVCQFTDVNFIIELKTDNNFLKTDTRELKDALNVRCFNQVSDYQLIKELFSENLQSV
jgi:hypothetical protein